MINKKVLPLIGLILFAGITCTLLPRFTPTPTPVQQTVSTPFTLDDALTLAHQTIDAEIPVTGLRVLGEHHVAEGETLECIGRGYKVLPEAIASFNQIDPASDLEVGQVLKIPAIIWTNIPPGPICRPQFDISEWLAYVGKHSQTTATPTPTPVTTNTKSNVKPTQTLWGFDKPTETQCPPNIQMPCGGPTLAPPPCCELCLVQCTPEPPHLHIKTDTPASPHPPDTQTPKPPEPTRTLIPITLPPVDPCFPPPCLPTFSFP